MQIHTCLNCGITFYSNRKKRVSCENKDCQIKVQNYLRREYKKQWNKENQISLNKSKKVWMENNPCKRKEVSSSYRKKHLDYYSSYTSVRSRHMKQAQPSWQDQTELLDVYKEAAYMQLEVDHIIPIKHKLVCGLHVVSNLQLLSRSENAKKSNKFEILDNEDCLLIIKE